MASLEEDQEDRAIQGAVNPETVPLSTSEKSDSLYLKTGTKKLRYLKLMERLTFCLHASRLPLDCTRQLTTLHNVIIVD